MRISDWSSDVCSSDLARRFARLLPHPRPLRGESRSSDVHRHQLFNQCGIARLTSASGDAAFQAAYLYGRAACDRLGVVECADQSATAGSNEAAPRIAALGGHGFHQQVVQYLKGQGGGLLYVDGARLGGIEPGPPCSLGKRDVQPAHNTGSASWRERGGKTE